MCLVWWRNYISKFLYSCEPAVLSSNLSCMISTKPRQMDYCIKKKVSLIMSFKVKQEGQFKSSPCTRCSIIDQCLSGGLEHLGRQSRIARLSSAVRYRLQYITRYDIAYSISHVRYTISNIVLLMRVWLHETTWWAGIQDVLYIELLHLLG